MHNKISGEKKNNVIWAFGGGKGGTGKSFIASNMGSCLAEKEKKTILIDLDFGGANLHSFIGIKKPNSTLVDFFEKGVALKDLVEWTGVSNLGLITGNLRSFNFDGGKYAQRLKLFRHIKTLDCDHIVIDLGAGSHFTTLDAFLTADRMIVVINPEKISIENLYVFIKSALVRKLNFVLKSHDIKYLFKDIWKSKEKYGIKNIRNYLDCLREQSDTAGEIIDSVIADFKIDIIINQVRDKDDIEIGNLVKSVFLKYLGIKSQYTGCIDYENEIRLCNRKGQLFTRTYSTSPMTKDLEKLMKRLL